MRILLLTFAYLAGTATASAQTLTAQDYAEIRNFAQYYNLGYDSTARADGGAVVARSFTEIMSFTRDGGPSWFSAKDMAEYAENATVGTHHWDTNIVIAPHPEGASLFRYTLVYRVNDSGAPTISTAGTLQEVWVKNDDGWFMKTRYNRSTRGERPLEFPLFDGRPIAPAQADRPSAEPGQLPLSPLDYIEIEMLYGWNNIALDSVAENGEMFARTFTPDGSLQIDGRTVAGRQGLAEYAAGGQPGLRRWLSNLYIESTEEGAVGWAYVLMIDGFPATGGTRSSATLQSGGLYRDVLVKTADGWRFKSRTFNPGNTLPAASLLPKVR